MMQCFRVSFMLALPLIVHASSVTGSRSNGKYAQGYSEEFNLNFSVIVKGINMKSLIKDVFQWMV